MNIINLIDLGVDEQLSQIWEEFYKDDKSVIAPIYPEAVLHNSVTFLSLNPSLQKKEIDKASKGFNPHIPYTIIDYNNREGAYKFFNKFYEIGDSFKPWTFLDLLFIRATNQHDLEKLFDSKESSVEAFFFNQIELTLTILKKMNPKVVVISNKFADILLYKYILKNKIEVSFPSNDNGNIYRIQGIPFIVQQSTFLGSRIHAMSKEKKTILKIEINRVLNECIK